VNVEQWAALIGACTAFLTAVTALLHSVQTRRKASTPVGAQPRFNHDRDLFGP
jgi:hypothetical protein